jgi:hypothetical protein
MISTDIKRLKSVKLRHACRNVTTILAADGITSDIHDDLNHVDRLAGIRHTTVGQRPHRMVV